MNENDANTFRKATARAYIGAHNALRAAVATLAGPHANDTQVTITTDYLWDHCHFEDIFYNLGVAGYKELINNGWNPTKRGDT